MILQSLRALALREGLVDDPAFESKPVRWVIELRADGRFRTVYDTNSAESLPAGSKKKPRQEATLMVIPRRQVRSSGVRANFLVDNAKYVLGVDAEGSADDPRNRERHAAYLDLLGRVPAATPELQAVQAFLENAAELTRCLAELKTRDGYADNDLFTFEIDGEMLHKVEALRLHWSQGGGVTSEGAAQEQCLVCGDKQVRAPIHNQIQIRGGSTSGVPLVSFNSEAFESYGWSGNANAPVCADCMTAYVEALRRLTRARYDDPRGKRLSPLSTVLNGDTTAIYWADADDPLTSSVAFLREQPKRVADLLKAPRAGLSLPLTDAGKFFCLMLTGTQGRAIVRRMHTGTVAEVGRNLARYFAAIDVDRYDRGEPLPQFRLLKAIVLNGELDRLPAELGTELWLAALFGSQLSRIFLNAVVSRNRAERKVTSERAALLHLFFELSRFESPFKTTLLHDVEETNRPMSLNREIKDPPYLLGRLLAVLENIQIAAQGQKLNRTLVDRTYGAASTRPAVVFPQLIQTAQHHFAKAGKRAKGRTVTLDKMLGEIMDALDPDGFTATLNLEGQGKFALGYYHQRQSFFRNNDAPADYTAVLEEESAA